MRAHRQNFTPAPQPSRTDWSGVFIILGTLVAILAAMLALHWSR